jgi:hypothetical protein
MNAARFTCGMSAHLTRIKRVPAQRAYGETHATIHPRMHRR